MSGVLGVEIVVLASPASILFVLGRDLEHGNSGLLHKPQQASAIAAGRFHANALQVAKRPHPGQHLPMPCGSWRNYEFPERDPVRPRPPHMQIFVRIHAADDATLQSFDDSHSQPPALTLHERLRRADAWTGRSRDHVRSGRAEFASRRQPGKRSIAARARPGTGSDRLTVGVMQQRTRAPRRQIAINNASVTSCALISGFIDQPTTRRENRSITATR